MLSKSTQQLLNSVSIDLINGVPYSVGGEGEESWWSDEFRIRVSEMEERCRGMEDEIRERMEGSTKGRNSVVWGMKRCWFEKKSVSGVSLADASEDSTLLDIAVSSGQVDLVLFILSKKTDLTFCRNIEGDLSLHVAARTGQLHSLISLTLWSQFLKEREALCDAQCGPHTILMSEADSQGNTALHIAVGNHQEAMSWYLVFKHPQASYCINVHGKCPLYIAMKGKCWDLVKYMLMKEPIRGEAAIGLLQGKSVVHAAIISRNKEVLHAILVRNPFLCDCLDANGRTPLSSAACIGYSEGVQFFFDHFPNYTFKRDKDGSFPIHKACSGGYVRIVKQFLSQFPSTGNLLNKQGQNILHVAAKCGKTKLAIYLLSCKELDLLVNLKDVDGNTPLHLATMNKHPNVVCAMIQSRKCELDTVNADGLTVLDAALNYDGPLPTFEERLTRLVLSHAGASQGPYPPEANEKPKVANFDSYKDRVNTLLLVGTLVITVTFAAGITVPGGYNNSDPYEGMATLVKSSAFHAFMISNTIAMFSSILVAVVLIWAQLGDLKLILVSVKFAVPMLGISLSMMSIAFMVGTNLVVSNLHWLAVVMLVMGSAFLIVILMFFVPLYSPSSMSSWITKYAFYIPLRLMLFANEWLMDEDAYE
ncbi:hypothetical protein Droror1_Dr00020453 [Drosera rotundifolia]